VRIGIDQVDRADRQRALIGIADEDPVITAQGRARRDQDIRDGFAFNHGIDEQARCHRRTIVGAFAIGVFEFGNHVDLACLGIDGGSGPDDFARPVAFNAPDHGAEVDFRARLCLAGGEGEGKAEAAHLFIVQRQRDFDNIIGEDPAERLAGGNDLANIDIAFPDASGERRVDGGPFQGEFRILQLRLGGIQCGAGLGQLRFAAG
jgi:hypothetical protein